MMLDRISIRMKLVNADGTPTTYFLSLDDRLKTALGPLMTGSTGWTAGTGTANKGAFATYAGQTHGASYSQTAIQTLDNAAKASSQRIKAIEDALRTIGLFDG